MGFNKILITTIIIIIYKSRSCSSNQLLMPETGQYLDVFNCVETITNIINPKLRAKITIDYPFELDYSYLVRKVSAHMPTTIGTNFESRSYVEYKLFDYLIYVSHDSPNRWYPTNTNITTHLNILFATVLDKPGIDDHIILLVYLGGGPLENIFKSIILKEDVRYLQRVIFIDINGNIYIFERDSNKCNKPHFTSEFSCNNINRTQIAIAFNINKFKKIHGCNMRILYEIKSEPFVTNQKPVLGIDTKLMHELVRLLNVTVTDDEEETNLLVFGCSELSFYNIGIKSFLTTPYYFDSYVYAMPKKLLQKSIAIVYIFTKEFWALIVIAFMLFLLACFKIFKYSRRINKLSFWKLFAIFIGQTVDQPNYLLHRLPFMTWALYALIITNAFNGSLLKFLIEPMYEPQIITAEDLTPKWNRFSNWWRFHSKQCSEHSNCLKKVIKGEDYIFIPKSVLDTMAWELKNEHFNVIYSHPKYVRVNVFKYQFLNLVEKYVKQIVESGLVTKWTNDVLSRRFVINYDEHQKLSMRHFLLIYYLLIFGWVIATIVFLIEYFYSVCLKRIIG